MTRRGIDPTRPTFAAPLPARPQWWPAAQRQLLRPWVWILLFLASRVWIWVDYVTRYRYIENDVHYYQAQLFANKPFSQTLVEYPQPVVWLMQLIGLFGRSTDGYLVAFGLAMALLDAGFCVALWYHRSLSALAFWNVFVLLGGAILYSRYDMIPALVVGLAALWVATRPRLAGALVAIGASLKLWPAMLIAPLVGRTRPGRQRLVWFVLTGSVIAALAWVQAGWARLISPLGWQSGRGLQVESVPANLLMVARSAGGNSQWTIAMSKYNAYEIAGPGTDLLLRLSDVGTALALLLMVALAVVALVRRQLPADVMVLGMISMVSIMLVTNKTLSPQYLLWLGTPVAALLVVAAGSRMRRKAWWLAGLALVASFCTQQVFPVYYGQVVNTMPASMVLLSVRNLMLVCICALATVWTWSSLMRPTLHAEPTDEALATDEVALEILDEH